MRRVVAVSLALNVLLTGVALLGFFGGQAFRRIPGAHADGARPCTLLDTGDVNGDGTINLSDPIYLLNHLFRGGPALVPIGGVAAPCEQRQ